MAIAKVNVLLELDVLLDTRLATIARISEAKAVEILNKGYFERQSDEFWKMVDIPEKEYLQLYANRDNETLHASVMTMFCALSLRSMLLALIEQVISTPYADAIEITINTWPYTLSDDEQIQMHLYMQHVAEIEFSVDFINRSYDALTPAFVDQHFAMIMLYDYDKWIAMHGQAMIEKPIRGVKLYAPAIYKVKVPEIDELEDLRRQGLEPMECTRWYASPMIDLEFMHVANFSVLDIKTLRDHGLPEAVHDSKENISPPDVQ